MEDRFGKMPMEVKDMIDLVRCRWKAQTLQIEKITLKSNILKLYFVSKEIPQEIVLKVIQFVNNKKGQYRTTNDTTSALYAQESKDLENNTGR
jgi:transcription-repair coupling factor (superfamily II helicase)